MIGLISLLAVLQAPLTIPSPPEGVGPYQRRVSPPAPAVLTLTEVEKEFSTSFAALVATSTLTCEEPALKARIKAGADRFAALEQRLRNATDPQRLGQIARATLSNPRNLYIPGCPASELAETRVSALEKALDTLEPTLTRNGH